MTAQSSEKLVYKGETHSLCSQPLGPFVENNKLPLKFYATSTALWRGYIGTWTIESRHLYLVKLKGTIKEGEYLKDVALDALFPDYPDGVFAHWYTGTLRCPMGGLLKYVHGGYGSVYEEDLIIDISKGVVTDERVVRNGTASPDARKGYALGAATFFGEG